MVLIDQFWKTKEINGVTINGVLDECHLREQSTHFSKTMMEQYDLMQNPREEGLVTKLWTKLAKSKVLWVNIKIFQACWIMFDHDIGVYGGWEGFLCFGIPKIKGKK